jgi:hypothetical protein
MTARVRFGLAVPLIAASALVAAHVFAAAPAEREVALMRTSLSQRALWGPDYSLLIASIPAWAQAQEKTILIAPDLIIGGTPFRSAAEAEKRAAALRAALVRTSYSLGPDFAAAAREAKPAADRVEVRRYGTDGSYRTVIGRGVGFLPPTLSLAAVQSVLGKEASVKREVEDGGGEHRPVVFTSHAWAGGAVVYQTSNYAPTPDQVVRVVLNVQPALRAIAEPQ